MNTRIAGSWVTRGVHTKSCLVVRKDRQREEKGTAQTNKRFKKKDNKNVKSVRGYQFQHKMSTALCYAATPLHHDCLTSSVSSPQLSLLLSVSIYVIKSLTLRQTHLPP